MLSSDQEQVTIDYLLGSAPDLIVAYLFGSVAQETQGPESDVDLPVLMPQPLEPWKRWTLAQRLASFLRSEVDLVDLRRASSVLRMQVISSGRCLYESDRRKREVFENYVYSSYARLNEERWEILKEVRDRGQVYG